MSHIIDVVIVAMLGGEDDAVACVNEHLAAAAEGQRFMPLDMSAAGGFKAITADVCAGSFSYLDWAGARAALMAAPWRFPAHVTVCADGEDFSERFWPGGRR